MMILHKFRTASNEHAKPGSKANIMVVDTITCLLESFFSKYAFYSKGTCHTKMKGVYKMCTCFKEDNCSADRCSTKKSKVVSGFGANDCKINATHLSQGKWLCTTGTNTPCSP